MSERPTATGKGVDASSSVRGAAAMSGSSDARLIQALRAMERFRFTVTRPVAVLMVFIAIVVFGGFSGTRLPLNLMPDISYPRLTVRTEYPGAAPAEVENNVSRPLEEILGVVTGLTRISSVSRGGYSDVILEFAWDTDMDDANQDVLEKLDTVKPALPEEIKQPLILRYDPTLDPVLTLSLSGDDESFEGIAGLKYLRKIADRDVRRLIEPIEGVAAVKVKGGLEEEIEIRLDEDELRRTGISIATVIQRLQNENINVAGGNMRDGRTRYLVRTVNEFRNLDDMREMVVVSRDGRDIKLGNIAAVSSGYKDRDVITRVNGDEAVEIEVYKEADANIVDMAAKVTARLGEQVRPRIEREYGARLEIITDRSLFIESSIDEVRSSALWGGLIAIGVLLLFLRDFKTTTIVAVAIPVSVLVAFAPMNLAGVSLNIMSLGGMALGVGMLVDNSIVVLESIHRCREEGDDMIRATLRGTSEVGSAVIAATLTSIAVFFPMVFVEGVAGQMFGDLGLTVVFSLLASLAVALFLIPMLASRQWFGEREDRPARAVLRSFVESWTTWRSVRECVRDLKAAGWRLLLIVPLLYILVRALLHLAFELVGKLIVTALVISIGALVSIGGVLAWVIGKLLTPALWLFDLLLRGLEFLYPAVIRWCLRNRALVLAAVLGAFASMFWAVPQLDTELIPEMHQGEFTVELNLPVGTPLSITDETMLPIERELEGSVPRLRTLVTTIGSERDSTESGERGEHTARMRVALTTQRTREVKAPRGAGDDAEGAEGSKDAAEDAKEADAKE
ncbi:MAG: efflux RND transporter permease subunit, partial [Myxococcales bacterium]|nr:efflux RND transporter permease subunit [Myxococcales bacterium]